MRPRTFLNQQYQLYRRRKFLKTAQKYILSETISFSEIFNQIRANIGRYFSGSY